MKKTLKTMFLVALVIVAMGSIYAETFEKVELLDDFGDPTGTSFIQAKDDFDGTYKNINGVSNGKIKWNIKVEDGKVTFIIKENGKVNALSTAKYTTDKFEVKVKDNESGNTTTYTGVVSRGEEGNYNCIEVVTVNNFWYLENALASYLNNGADCKVVISNDRGSYSLGALNGSEIIAAQYDFKTFEAIKKAFEAGEYDKVNDMISSFKSDDSSSFNHFKSELDVMLFDIANALGVFVIGQIGPAGGYIFYDCDADNESGNADGLVSSECGWRYLEAAPADLRVANGVPTVDSSLSEYESASVLYFQFGNYRTSDSGDNLYVNGTTEYSVSDCTGTAIGQGETNTEKLVEAMGESAYSEESGSYKTENYAAKHCLKLEHNGYGDWFLPSKDELDLMYNNLKVNDFGSISGSYYWSSSENSTDVNSAVNVKFNSSLYGYSYSRSARWWVRPCRAF